MRQDRVSPADLFGKPVEVLVPKDRYKSRLEREYAFQLEMRQRAGELETWLYEPWKFRLADGRWYKPDFVVVTKDRVVEVIEVKGYSKNLRDSETRWITCAERYPWFRWVWVVKRRDLGFVRTVYGERAGA